MEPTYIPTHTHISEKNKNKLNKQNVSMPMEGYRVVRRWLGPQGGLRAEEQRQAPNGKRAAEGAKELPVIVIFLPYFFLLV